MSDIKMVVFDMAGTTVNENNLVYKTVQKAINQEGYNVRSDDVLQHGAGKEKHKAITDVLEAHTKGGNIAEIAGTIFENFKIALEKAYDEEAVFAFEGMEDFFQNLKQHDIKVVLNTGYDFRTANKLMEKLNWHVGVQIDALITSDDVEKGRPHPDMILKAMSDFGIEHPSQVLKAGDSQIDIIEGKNAGCGITVGVLSGAQNKEQLLLVNPDYILQNVTDLAKMLF